MTLPAERDSVFYHDIITKSPWVDVRAYGAVGDGVTDSTAAIQAAIDVAEVSGGIVFFPVGIYKITSSLGIEKSGVTLKGAGRSYPLPGGDGQQTECTTILFYGTDGAAIKINKSIVTDTWTSAYHVPFVKICNMNLLKYDPNNTDTTIGIKACARNYNLENLVIGGFQYGVYSYYGWINHFEDVDFGSIMTGGDYPCDIGIYLFQENHATHINNCGFHWCRQAIAGVDIGYVHVTGCTIEQMTGGGVWGATNARGITFGVDNGTSFMWIKDCYLEATGDYGIYVGDVSDGQAFAVIEGCRISNESGTDIYVDYGQAYTSFNRHGGVATDIASSANGVYRRYNEASQIYDKLITRNTLGVGAAGFNVAVAYNGLLGLQPRTVAKDTSDYIEVSLGSNGHFAFSLFLSGKNAACTKNGYILASVYGYLQANALQGDSGVDIIDSGGTFGTINTEHISVESVAASGAGNKIKVEIKNNSAAYDWTVNAILTATSTNNAPTDWTLVWID